MDFDEVRDKILALLQRDTRVSYRGLKRRFALDDEYLEDLKEDLLYTYPQVVDDEGRGLIWHGKAENPSASQPEPAQPPSTYTPSHLAERIRAEQAAMESRGAAEGERKTITALSVAVLLIAIVASPAYSQQFRDMAPCIAYLSHTDVATSTASSQTGFLVAGGEKHFLLTAKHGVAPYRMDDSVILSGRAKKPLRFTFRDLIGEQESLAWRTDSQSDVAVLKLSPSSDVLGRLSGHFLPMRLLTEDLDRSVINRPVGIGGFPRRLGISPSHVSPISKKARLASGIFELQASLYGKAPVKVVVLDKPSIGGMSGAPVIGTHPYWKGNQQMLSFSSRGEPIIGVVSANTVDKLRGKMAIVFPAMTFIHLLR